MLKSIAAKKENNRININFKATQDQKDQLQKLADKYADGNLTAWVLYASTNYKPSKEELVDKKNKRKS